MQILHIDTGLHMRGGQELTLLCARGLRRRGHVQTIACPHGSALQKAALAEGYPVLAIPPGDRTYIRSVLATRRFLRHNHCEVVHAHSGHGQTLSWLSSTGLPVRRIATRVVTFQPRNVVIHRWKYTHSCHCVIALSPAVRDVMLRNGIPERQIEVIVGGIDFPERLPSPEVRSRMRTSFGVGKDEFVIGQVAAFTSEKGQADALAALLLLLPTHPEMRMILLGDGPTRGDPAMQRQLRLAMGAAQAPGYIEASDEFYGGLDLLLVPSLSEALSLSAIRAMANGLPVIATNVGGLPEVVIAGETGWLVPPGDARALAAAIAEAVSDPARLSRFGQRGRERARTFSSDAAAERTEALYYRVLRGSGLLSGRA